MSTLNTILRAQEPITLYLTQMMSQPSNHYLPANNTCLIKYYKLRYAPFFWQALLNVPLYAAQSYFS